MLKLIRRDLLLIFSNWKIGIFLFLLMPLMLLGIGAEGINEVIIINILAIGYLFTVIPFDDDLKMKPNLLIQSLPIRRVEVVISRYISIFVNFIIGVVYTVTYLWIIKYFKILNVDIFNIYIIKEAFLILILVSSITLPGFFVFKSRMAIGLGTFTLTIGSINFIIGPERVFGRLERLNYLSGIIIVLYFISLGLSIWFYERKDLV